MKEENYRKLSEPQKQTLFLMGIAHDHAAVVLNMIRSAQNYSGEFELDGLGGLTVNLANQIQAYIDRMERSVEDVEASRR